MMSSLVFLGARIFPGDAPRISSVDLDHRDGVRAPSRGPNSATTDGDQGMHDGSQGNAMTEIALALAISFFSLLVPTMVSMGAGHGGAGPTPRARAGAGPLLNSGSSANDEASWG